MIAPALESGVFESVIVSKKGESLLKIRRSLRKRIAFTMSDAARVALGRCGVKIRMPELEKGRKSMTFASST